MRVLQGGDKEKRKTKVVEHKKRGIRLEEVKAGKQGRNSDIRLFLYFFEGGDSNLMNDKNLR